MSGAPVAEEQSPEALNHAISQLYQHNAPALRVLVEHIDYLARTGQALQQELGETRAQLAEQRQLALKRSDELRMTREQLKLANQTLVSLREPQRNDQPPAVQAACKTCGSPFTPDHSLATGHTQ